jgi:hypothetical protein
MGCRFVAFSFEDALVTMTTDVNYNVKGGHFVVNPYTEQRRHELVQLLAANVSDDVCTFIVSLLSQGIAVGITTEVNAADYPNGDVVRGEKDEKDTNTPGFRFDGKDLIQRVLVSRLGPDIARRIEVVSLRSVLKCSKPHQVLLLHSSADIVKKCRRAHMNAINVMECGLGQTP